MFKVSTKTVISLAAVIWLSGAVILFIKGTSLLRQATHLNPDLPWSWLALLMGLAIGAIKTKYLFNRLCYKNIKRIESLSQPSLWNCYRVQFFIFLFLMVSLGAIMSRVAQGDYVMLLSVAIVDISIGSALLGSSLCFWRKLSA